MEPCALVWGLFFVFPGCLAFVHAKTGSLVSRDQDEKHPYEECLFLGKLEINLNLMLNDSTENRFNKYSTTLHSPDGGSIPANCSFGKAGVVLLSEDKRVGVSIVFQAQNGTDGRTWELTKLAVITKDDTSQGLDADVVSKRGFERSRGLMLFQTPYNRTIVCDTNQKVVFHSDRAHASLVFSHIGLEPQTGQAGKYKQNGFYCPKTLHDHTAKARDAQIFVPVILSVSLAVVVSLLVIGYLIHRKIEGLGYTSMD